MMLCRLLEDLDCTLVQGRSDIEVNAICCDSRSVTPGCVFVCLPGQHTDGRRFAHAAAAAGAAVLVFEGTLPHFEFSRSCSPALVQAEPGKARRALALMGARLYGYPARRMTMIGITGTKGKTTTAHLLAAVLTAAGAASGMHWHQRRGVAGTAAHTGLHHPRKLRSAAYFARHGRRRLRRLCDGSFQPGAEDGPGRRH